MTITGVIKGKYLKITGQYKESTTQLFESTGKVLKKFQECVGKVLGNDKRSNGK